MTTRQLRSQIVSILNRIAEEDLTKAERQILKLVTAKAKRRVPQPLPWDWTSEVARFSVHKADEGGRSFRELSEDLAAQGIPCRRDHSPYVGQYGVAVPKKLERKAEKIIFG